MLALRSDELRAFILQCQSVLAQLGEEPVRIVCLCGSTRYLEAFQWANLHETLAQHIVLGLGCYTKSDDQLFVAFSEAEKAKQKAKLDELHKRKIDLAHEILVLDVDTYIGSSTQSEIEYAQQGGKPIRYLSQEVSQEMQPGQKSEQGA